MLNQIIRNTKRELRHIESLVVSLNQAREGFIPYSIESDIQIFNQIDHTYWKAYDHCAVMVQLYASFERFVLNSVNEWIKWCLEFKSELIFNNDPAIDLYESGVAEILRRKKEVRFNNIDRNILNKSLSYFYNKPLATKATLDPTPFFATQPNLRLEHIRTLFNNVGLGNPEKWIQDSKEIKDMKEEDGYNIENELKTLVEKRNEAAHGNELPREILGKIELLNKIKIISNLCQAIYSYIVNRIIELEIESSSNKVLIGHASNIWRNSNAFELKTEPNILIHKGMNLAAISSGDIKFFTIKSIQLDGLQTKSYSSNSQGILGIASEILPSKKSKIINLKYVRGIIRN